MYTLSLESKFGWKVIVIENHHELPSLSGVVRMYADTETDGFDPYKGNKVSGLALLLDDSLTAYYIPVRHIDAKGKLVDGNIDLKEYQKWLKAEFVKPEVWCNQDVKFDERFMFHDGVEFPGKLECTLAKSKMINSDRMSHTLKDIVWDYLEIDIATQEKELKAVLKSLKAKKEEGYAKVPIDVISVYAAYDVFTARGVDEYLEKYKPDPIQNIWDLESKLIPVLVKVERQGLRVDITELQIEYIKTVQALTKTAEAIEDITNQSFINSNDHLKGLFIDKMNLPVLVWNKHAETKEVTGPSFNKQALKLYQTHPDVISNGEFLRVVQLINFYRTEATYVSLFLEPYLNFADKDGYLHPSYNQMVRTGRMSCRGPNATQLNKRAKRLIKPAHGKAILSFDASQLEFRFIIHYINDEETISAWDDDPYLDFHQWVADINGIGRRAAKTINFATAFGAGKKKILQELASNPDIILSVAAELGTEISTTGSRDRDHIRLCELRATKALHSYHERFPSLKRKYNEAQEVCKQLGYVVNFYGRRRHIDPRFAYKAFNSAIQGSANDFVKSKLLHFSTVNNEWLRKLGIEIFVNVHDEIGFMGDYDVLLKAAPRIKEELEKTPSKLNVPIIWDGQHGDQNWADLRPLDRNGELLMCDKINRRKPELQVA